MLYRYDLHIHSCLSPCADDDATPAAAAGFAKLAGLDIAALTDHNSALNCAVFLRAAAEYGLVGIPGMELTTAEDIHVLCLFRSLEGALAFGEYVDSRMMKIKLREDIFGAQLIKGEDDEVTGRVGHLLTFASGIGFNEVPALIRSYGGVAVPAHIDKGANSALEVLAGIPAEAGYRAFEIYRPDRAEEISQLYFGGQRPLLIHNSDAHSLGRIAANGLENSSTTGAAVESAQKNTPFPFVGGVIELDCEPGELAADKLADALLDLLEGGCETQFA